MLLCFPTNIWKCFILHQIAFNRHFALDCSIEKGICLNAHLNVDTVNLQESKHGHGQPNTCGTVSQQCPVLRKTYIECNYCTWKSEKAPFVCATCLTTVRKTVCPLNVQVKKSAFLHAHHMCTVFCLECERHAPCTYLMSFPEGISQWFKPL